MTTQYKKTSDSIINEEEKLIVRYLRNHPDFFERHLDLLADMTLPHNSGTISLIERQVQILREQKETNKRKLVTLIQNAQTNERLSEHVNKLILALLDASDLDAVLDILQTRLIKDFEADYVVVRLFDTGHPAMAARPEIVDWSEPVMGAFEKVIKDRRPVCGRLKPGQLESLFNDAAGQVASAALIPLVESESSKTCYGLLAIGSLESERFRADMGTLFLSQIGNILSRVLKQKLEKV